MGSFEVSSPNSLVMERRHTTFIVSLKLNILPTHIPICNILRALRDISCILRPHSSCTLTRIVVHLWKPLRHNQFRKRMQAKTLADPIVNILIRALRSALIIITL